ncbi:hypothetical protein GOODEAATRI_032120 [Goodea atripinnis]|uniref:Uncharacterized protein n=1 Tax=Goodea atripinnis TaxID=208336 RepID=A0ABV0PIU7_9TELE
MLQVKCEGCLCLNLELFTSSESTTKYCSWLSITVGWDTAPLNQICLLIPVLDSVDVWGKPQAWEGNLWRAASTFSSAEWKVLSGCCKCVSPSKVSNCEMGFTSTPQSSRDGGVFWLLSATDFFCSLVEDGSGLKKNEGGFASL